MRTSAHSHRDPFADWQGDTLHLPVSLREDDCVAIDWTALRFPGSAAQIDSSALEHVDSVGVAALLLLERRARTQNIALTWTPPGAALARLLAVYELEQGVFHNHA